MTKSKLRLDHHSQRLLRARIARLRTYTLPLIFVLVVAIVILLFPQDIFNLDQKPIFKWLIPIVGLLTAIGYFALRYLEGNSVKPFPRGSNAEIFAIGEEMRYMMNELQLGQASVAKENIELFNRLQIQIEDNHDFKWNSEQQEQLFQSIKESFTQNVDTNFFNKLNEQITVELTKEKRNRLDAVSREFQSIKNRLISEIEMLNRKANLNLVIGSMATTIALAGLAYVVFQHDRPFQSYPDMIYHYVPRISLVVFIEVFAYFFLRLYKLNLEDTKYFQNELTNVELKLVATSTAISFGKDVDLTAIIAQLSTTERNFVLKKGETTVELEKSRIDRNEIKTILANLPYLINKGKK